MEDSAKSTRLLVTIILLVILAFIGVQVYCGNADSDFIHLCVTMAASAVVIAFLLNLRRLNDSE